MTRRIILVDIGEGLILRGILPGVALYAAYSAQVSATGGQAPYVYSLDVGAAELAAAGITLDPQTGYFTSPSVTVAGDIPVAVRATDITGAFVVRRFVVSVTTNVATLKLTGSFASAVAGTAYSSDLVIAGGTGGYTLTGGTGVVSGSLPAGLSLSIVGSKLRLSGTPTGSTGTVSVTVGVDSGDGQQATSAQNIAVSNPTSSYVALVASYAPDDWWRLDETTGTTAAGSGSSGYNGELTGGATFASTGVSIAAPTGYAGLGRGVDFAASGVGDIRITSAITPRAAFAQTPVSSDPWTIVITVAGSAGASQYLASRVNSAAIIYQFVADTVEFFGVGYVGSDPRPGSQIPLDSSDTTTPHQLAYRYDSGVWSGFKDGVKVFSVSRTFVMQGSFDFYLGSDSGTNVSFCKTWDYQGYNRALTDTEIADMWAARDMA